MRKKRLDPDLYDSQYFFSERCEGFYEFNKNQLSPVKKVEFSLLDIKPSDIVLDIGCGRGDITQVLSQNNINFRGIDYSKSAVELSRKRVSKSDRKRITKQDALALEFADSTFTKILIGDVIEHMTFSDALRVVNEAHRVLKPGGKIVIHTAPNLWFKKVTYPILLPILRILGFNSVADSAKENIDATYTYHLDEYSIIHLRKLMFRSHFKESKVWIHPDALRLESINYLSSLKKNGIINFCSTLINRSPLLLFFGNDLFAVGRK